MVSKKLLYVSEAMQLRITEISRNVRLASIVKLRRWKPSKSAIADFKEKMDEVKEFCDTHNIHYSKSMDSFYFTLNGQNYRVSNHSVESSNRHAFTEEGEQIRELYHEGGRLDDTVYIHASKTRVKEIYQNLEAGKILDGRGRIK